MFDFAPLSFFFFLRFCSLSVPTMLQHGYTPLHGASENYGDKEAMSLLLSRGADVNAKDNVS